MEAARFQAPRIAAIRSIPIQQVETLIDQHTQQPTLGVFGEPRVDVLELNVALEEVAPRT